MHGGSIKLLFGKKSVSFLNVFVPIRRIYLGRKVE
jgi:hypothetical protein